MTSKQLMNMLSSVPEDTRIVVNNENNDWGDITFVSVGRSDDDDFDNATVVIEYKV